MTAYPTSGAGKSRSSGERLVKAVEWSRRAMEPFRRKRLETLKVMYGAHFNDGAVGVAQPVNLLELTVRIWCRSLAARAPSVEVSARRREMSPVAADFEAVLKDLVREIDLRSTLGDWVFEAITAPLGVVKVGITEKALAEQEGYLHDAGQPFCDPVDMDDLVVDMAASRWESQSFVGNRYILPLEAAKDSKLFRGKDLRPANPSMFDEMGNMRAARLQTVQRGWTDERFAEDMVELWDVWRPRDRVVCTYVSNETGLPVGEPVREVDWDGPEYGPYHMLSYGRGKGMMRLPPIASLRDLSDSINKTFRKLLRQQDRQKQVTMVAGGAEEDGNRLVKSSDGDTIRVDRPEATKEVKFGGIDPSSLAFALQQRDLFSYLAGNLDSQGGLSQVASTATQEELIRTSSSQAIEDMQATTTAAAKGVCEALAFWAWSDPKRDYAFRKPLGSSGLDMPATLKAKDREPERFVELAFDIRPSSMQDTTNSQRLRTMTETAQRFVVPLVPVLQSQGMEFDIVGFLDRVADLTGTEEVAGLVVPGARPQADDAVMGDPRVPGGFSHQAGMPKPQETTRNYVRRNVPTGGTRASRDAAMAQAAMGANLAPQVAAPLAR